MNKNATIRPNPDITVYLWYVAIGKGNLEPLLDFAIDGQYADKYEKAVKPKFGRPEENLYLY